MLPGRPDVFALEQANVPRAIQAIIIESTKAQPEERPQGVEDLIQKLESTLPDLQLKKSEKKLRTSPAVLAASMDSESHIKQEVSMEATQVSTDRRRDSFVPFWLYALVVIGSAVFVAAINIYIIQSFEKMLYETGVALPVLTSLYLKYRWILFILILLALPFYPLLNRLGRGIALFTTVLATIAFYVFLVLALFLPLIYLVQKL
jgi:hypothetical protein